MTSIDGKGACSGNRRRLRMGVFAPFPSVMALALSLTASAALADPQRVVSLNVCTDQMAMLVAAEGQLYSVSHLAADPSVSTMADTAQRYAINYGLAEEIFMMKPDLVLAGTYTTRSTVELLRKLGIAVEEFSPATSFDEVRADFRRMGQLLGREEKVQSILAGFDAELAALAAQPPTGKSVALYYANSYTSGSGTLVDAVVEVAGVDNIGRRLGLSGTAKLPLEALILANPDIIVLGDHQYSRPALAQANFSHPAFEAFISDKTVLTIPPPATICGGPFTVDAARVLRIAADEGGRS
jgi:iron complex transport system substrate-binding protein